MLTTFALVTALLFAAPAAETPECAAIHALVGGELVEWQGYPDGWNLPDDMSRTDWIDFASGGIIAYWSESEQARYVIVFTSYEATADSNGNHYGQHSFCGYYRITDA